MNILNFFFYLDANIIGPFTVQQAIFVWQLRQRQFHSSFIISV